MTNSNKPTITIETTVNATIDQVWKAWNAPEHITQWAIGSPDWHTPRAENDLRVGGAFLTRMEAKDGSTGFDFTGTYEEVQRHKTIAYTMDDGRKVRIMFADTGRAVKIVETFEAETQNPLELQREGWQTILNNFKKHVESTP